MFIKNFAPINLLVIFILMISFSCKNQKAEQEKLQKEVIEQHDVLMTRMDVIYDNQSALSKIEENLDSLKTIQTDLDTVNLKSEIINLKSLLANADDAMMKWMNYFKTDYEGRSDEEILDYLNKEKIKIDSVKTLFDQSLSKSGALIQKYK